MPHFIRWEHTVEFDSKETDFTVALPGKLKTVSLSTINKNRTSIVVSWMPNQALQKLPPIPGIALHDFNHWTPRFFPLYPGYRMYPFMMEGSGVNYHLVKYFQESCAYEHPKTLSSCKHMKYHPKMFSWNNAMTICKKANGTLPVLFGKADQDELKNLIKELPFLFPIEAVYIALKKNKSNQVDIVTCMHLRKIFSLSPKPCCLDRVGSVWMFLAGGSNSCWRDEMVGKSCQGRAIHLGALYFGAWYFFLTCKQCGVAI